MPKPSRGTWVGVVGPDGSGKTALVEELRIRIEADGLDVAHTHGRPQSIARRTPPAHADPSKPHAAKPRGLLLSMAKYLLAVLDFMVARRRLLRSHDIWLCERPLLDYEVDPTRYQLDRRLLPVIRRLNTLIPGPEDLLLLSGDAQIMADRKGELDAAEIDRQLSVWQRVGGRVAMRTHTLDTTRGGSVAEIAGAAAAAIRSPARLKWRVAPVKPTRLDVRHEGSDMAALDVYRPIRLVARVADRIGTTLTKVGLTPRTSSPDPAIDSLIGDLRADGWPIAGVAAMASSAPNRWIVGLADRERLTHVLKVGPSDDAGLIQESRNLQTLRRAPNWNGVSVPQSQSVPDGNRAVIAFRAAPGPLHPVTSPDVAAVAAVVLVENGWTHGDFAPWNLFSSESDRLVLLDWEMAEETVRPLSDFVHFLSRLGATTHPRAARSAFRALITGSSRFDQLLLASNLRGNHLEIRAHVEAYLADTAQVPMSAREDALRAWMRSETQIQGRSTT